MVGIILGFAGLWLLWWRWLPKSAVRTDDVVGPFPKVSIIVPARNEVKVIARLLKSLELLSYPDFEMIVVDDRSEDGTGDLVRVRKDPRLQVVVGTERPDGWGGKQWACHQGSLVATGSVLLFTDADTEHREDSLLRAVGELRRRGAGMLSTLPYHEGKRRWERLLGPFHVMLLTVTAPHGDARPGRVFAIGQYLMFTREAYHRLGGHEAVKSFLVEDLPLANACLRAKIPYAIVTGGAPLFGVRMYEKLPDFLAGWRRNFRAGLKDSTWLAPFEITAMIAALCGGGQGFTPLGIGLSLLAMGLVAWRQHQLGRFSPLGALLFPWSIMLFCLATALAAFDMIFRRGTVWKGRTYL